MNIPTDIVKINYIDERKVDFFVWCRENQIEIIVNEREEINQRANQFYASANRHITIMKDGNLGALPLCVGFTPEDAIKEIAHYLSDSVISIADLKGLNKIFLNVPALGFDIN